MKKSNKGKKFIIIGIVILLIAGSNIKPPTFKKILSVSQNKWQK